MSEWEEEEELIRMALNWIDSGRERVCCLLRTINMRTINRVYGNCTAARSFSLSPISKHIRAIAGPRQCGNVGVANEAGKLVESGKEGIRPGRGRQRTASTAAVDALLKEALKVTDGGSLSSTRRSGAI